MVSATLRNRQRITDINGLGCLGRRKLRGECDVDWMAYGCFCYTEAQPLDVKLLGVGIPASGVRLLGRRRWKGIDW